MPRPRFCKDLADLVMPGRDKLRVLDLGCGTGLAGLLFKPCAARLTGIDLSPAMIEKARARDVYDSLIVGDIETALIGEYDLILAADTLVYLGDLRPVFAAVADHLAPGGFFLFTTEAKEGPGIVQASNWVPNGAGGTARPICAKWQRRRGFPWPAWCPLHPGPNPINRFPVSPSH